MTPALRPSLAPALCAARSTADRVLRRWGEALRRRADNWARRRQAGDLYRSLSELDDHLLRDLGFHRSELRSVALHPSDPDRLWNRP